MKKEGVYDLVTIIMFLLGALFLISNNITIGFGLWILTLIAVLFKRQIL
ncbi:hypothetical protein HYW74_04085 [Candidatus Pacearchaeota archaeon]|nr:hypothetical protein [Candidatus Pacearchaeota archaeon]